MTNRSNPSPRVRSTRQRAAIVDALKRTAGFRSAQELHEELRRKGGRIGLTTVYRNLQALADAEEVDVLRNPAGELTYRLCDSSDHHHHLVCRSCGVSVEIENQDFERWVSRIARNHGFSDVTHVAAVYGLCRSCDG